MKRLRLSEIAARLNLKLQGDDCEIAGINTLDAAGPDELSFLANPKYIGALRSTRAAAVIAHPDFAAQMPRALISEQPYQDFARALTLFSREQGFFSGISELAFVHPEAAIGERAAVAPFACIGPRVVVEDDARIFPFCYVGEDCRIGAGSTLYPGAVLMAGTRIGQRCIVHAGVVLGADGFGFVRTQEKIEKIPQIGVVRIGDDVEVGANTTIDRAALDKTVIGDGTKIDNLVMVGHNVRMGKNSLMVAQSGIAGSTVLGDNVTVAGQAAVAGHLRIGDNVTIGPRAGVAKDIPDNMTMGGTPAVEQGVFLRTFALMPRFPELFKRLTRLEQELAALRADLHNKENA
jgi:UDP-3-O-[3-hydroxymyristoyl] glucosamine N-acyltransferase